MRSWSKVRIPFVSAALLGTLICALPHSEAVAAADTETTQGSASNIAADVPRLVGIVRRDEETRLPGTQPSSEARAALTQLAQAVDTNQLSPTFRAMALMALGEFEQACQVLTDSGVSMDELEPEGLLLLARCRDAAGDFDGAIAAYERLEQTAPNEYIIPLELGSTYQRAGRTSDARRAYQRALTRNPPPIIGQNLAAIVSQLRAADLWRVDLEGGFLYDSNINSGLGGGIVDVGGLEFDVIGGEEESGTGYYLEATGSALFPQDETVSILVQGFAATDRYLTDDDDDFDEMVFVASVGPVLQFDDTTLTLGPLGSVSFIDDEDQLWQVGFQSRVSQAIDDRFTGFAQAVYLRRQIRNSDAQDSDRYSALAGLEYLVTSNFQVAGGFEVVYEDASRGDFTHTDITPLISWNGQLTDELSFFGSFRYTDANYSEADPTFDIKRDDNIYRVDVNLAYDLSQWVYDGVELRGQYEYTERDSNNPLFQFDRHVVRIGVGITF